VIKDFPELLILRFIKGYKPVKGLSRVKCVIKDLYNFLILKPIKGHKQVKGLTNVMCNKESHSLKHHQMIHTDIKTSEKQQVQSDF